MTTRDIILDTETTGLDPKVDRIVEIGCVEVVDRFPTGRTFHVYLNPERGVPAEATEVHGLTDAFLADKPTFAAIAADFVAFISASQIIAHNAGFDAAFLNAELARLDFPPIAAERVVDTLALARRKHPMGPNSLDALCRRYGIENGHRTHHGALLDSELLAEVYIELTGGRQASMVLDVDIGPAPVDGVVVVLVRTRPLAPRLTEADLLAHAAMVAGLGDKAVWRTSGLHPMEQQGEAA